MKFSSTKESEDYIDRLFLWGKHEASECWMSENEVVTELETVPGKSPKETQSNIRSLFGLKDLA